jgi:putative transposase
MFLQRGLSFTHEAVRGWERKLAPLLSDTMRKRRHGAVGPSWYVDETYIKVQGQWCYLYRAIDRDGHLVDVRLSETRDLAAAEAFFRSAWTVTGTIPDRITTDGHDAYPRAIRNVFGDRVLHRTNRHPFVIASRKSARFSALSLTATSPSRWRSDGAPIRSDLPN